MTIYLLRLEQDHEDKVDISIRSRNRSDPILDLAENGDLLSVAGHRPDCRA